MFKPGDTVEVYQGHVFALCLKNKVTRGTVVKQTTWTLPEMGPHWDVRTEEFEKYPFTIDQKNLRLVNESNRF